MNRHYGEYTKAMVKAKQKRVEYDDLNNRGIYGWLCVCKHGVWSALLNMFYVGLHVIVWYAFNCLLGALWLVTWYQSRNISSNLGPYQLFACWWKVKMKKTFSSSLNSLHSVLSSFHHAVQIGNKSTTWLRMEVISDPIIDCSHCYILM